MAQQENAEALRKIRALNIGVSVILLILHFLYFCDPFLGAVLPAVHAGSARADPTQLIHDIATRLMGNIGKTGLFDNAWKSKGLALLFLVLSMVGVKGRKDERYTYKRSLQTIGVGLACYFGSIVLIGATWLYILMTISGFLIIMLGGSRLSRVLQYDLGRNDPFGRRKSGFPQEQRLIPTEYSLHLPAVYTHLDKEKDSWINVVNPRRGVLIIGSPGSGKSWFLIEPMLRQLIRKGMAICLYDFKYPQLTRLAYGLFGQYREMYPASAGFYYINFSDLSRTHRCNILDPATLEYISDALGASRTIMLSMNRTWIQKQGDFFVESPVNFLAAIIWYLKKYKDGIYCTLPHAIEMAQMPYFQLLSVLNGEPEIRTLIQPFIEAFENKTFELLNSQVSSARIPLGRIASPDLYYVLTGFDCNLAINDPQAPRILCLGGDPPRQEALAPVLSLYMDRLNKRVNRPDQYPCAIICDEFATIRAYSMSTVMATGRSNNIVPILAIQDLSQLRTQYTRDEADLILNISGNMFCGQVGGETAKWVSERIPRVQQARVTVSDNSADTSISHSLAWDNPVSPATIAGLSSGEFVGMIADEPGNRMELKAFHARLQREETNAVAPLPELPVVREIDAGEVQRHYLQIKSEVKGLIDGEIARMLANDDLINWVVKK